ncbi:hypothetical protein [Marinirhabdus gelatinilytica]|uniref:GLPGLI family protein n=1 Tax=Marinirhabdus gelatinilytica TaxID=1703343 RepID=A0A370QIF9_9FLAO|nr:hypothetical protein [Marinirhabdus gelatinilytica]RDK88138.1 hypothetical protein C8D94_1017 [Marinirhabdus gelatinilytica]
MKKNLIYFLLAVVTYSGTMQAQYSNRSFTSDMFRVDEYIKRQNKFVNYDDKDSYQGTPYNNENFLPGNIYKSDELLATNVAIRYNAVADEIEVKESLTTPDTEAKVLTKSPEIFVKIVNDIYIFAPYKGGIEGGGYFQVVYEGNTVDLYKKLQKDFNPEKKATSTLTQDIPAKFSDEITYFLADKSGKFYEMPKSRNKKLKVFGKKKNEVKNYVKDNRLDINDEKDLMKAVKFYDGSM